MKSIKYCSDERDPYLEQTHSVSYVVLLPLVHRTGWSEHRGGGDWELGDEGVMIDSRVVPRDVPRDGLSLETFV